jgi:hypothetical protein
MNDIAIFKLISGEEIIGTIVGTAPTHVELKDTITVTYHPAGDGKMAAGFAPHMPYADDNLILYTTAIALRAKIKDDMLNEYKRIFGGIITPPRQGIIT